MPKTPIIFISLSLIIPLAAREVNYYSLPSTDVDKRGVWEYNFTVKGGRTEAV